MSAQDGRARVVLGEGDAALDQRLSDELGAYNRVAAGTGDQREFTLRMEDAHGDLLAGLSG